MWSWSTAVWYRGQDGCRVNSIPSQPVPQQLCPAVRTLAPVLTSLACDHHFQGGKKDLLILN